ncbi:hypothetical protein [Clostridium sp.]|uniref:hypothetical protein n=1 Tax=Clostridium sp. TaxID=1506 RepID=UPI001A5A1C5E|nr:hypothetical protein [Clostridium sp.]MBK5241111.1 hypothetical protein [Clostridium sp.]
METKTVNGMRLGSKAPENFNNEEVSNMENERINVEDFEEGDKIIDLLRKGNCFKHTAKMAKVMEGQYGGGFYAAIYQDAGTRNSKIGVAIEYPDGTESKLLIFSQGEYLLAGQKGFKHTTINSKGRATTKTLTFVKKFEDSLMDYMSPNMPIWPDTLMRTIFAKYDKLPEIKAFELAPGIDEIYKYLLMIANELSSGENNGYINHKDYYRFRTDDFEKIAKGLGMKVSSLVDTLNSYGVISRTPSSVGSQTRIRYKNENFNTYNICKQSSAVHVNVQKNVEGEFPTVKFDRKYLSASDKCKFKTQEAEKEFELKLGIKNLFSVQLGNEFGVDIAMEKSDSVESSKSSKLDVVENSNSTEYENIESSKSSKL